MALTLLPDPALAEREKADLDRRTDQLISLLYGGDWPEWIDPAWRRDRLLARVALAGLRLGLAPETDGACLADLTATQAAEGGPSPACRAALGAALDRVPEAPTP